MAQELKIALVQTPILWENPEGNRKNLSIKIDSISKEVDLIVLPEMFTSGFTMTPQNLDSSEGIKTVKWMQRLSKKKGAAIVGSIVYNEEDKYYNRLWFVQPDGGLSSYDKRHTFTLAGEDKIYTRGKKKIWEFYKDFRFYPLICYDLRFPLWSRWGIDYEILIYVANWPKPRINAWDALLKARAIENMSYCIGVNRVGVDDYGHEYPGHSAIYDCLGEQIAYSEKEEIIYATLIKEHIVSSREKLKFLDDRDSFTID